MRFQRHFGLTLRQAPSGLEAASHRLLLRAGFVRQLGQGLYSCLPLAHRSITRIEDILREEMNRIGGQEMTMPVVHPAAIWQRSGRYDAVGPEMARFKDRKNSDLVLAMTHEEVVADLCRTEIRSHRQLPQVVYHIQTKFRDDPRPRAGLIRVREFTMKDSYTLDRDAAGLERQYRAHYGAYFRIFGRCLLPTIAVGSDVGMMGGSQAHEYMYLTAIGEDTLVLCDDDACGYAANRQVARFRKDAGPAEEPRPPERVATPGASTIRDLAAFLGIPESRTAKALFLTAGLDGGSREELVLAVIRGDMEVNETKLANAVGAAWLRPAGDDAIRAAGAAPGYASPIGFRGGTVVVDDLVPEETNLVAGANEPGFHLLHTNAGRDYEPDVVTDIAVAGSGCPCTDCGAPLRTSRGVEVGNIFQLGTRYGDAAGARFLDNNGEERPIWMGSYGIGSGRLLACIAEEHHDEAGLAWPASVAPFDVHLLPLSGRSAAQRRAAEAADVLYRELREAGLEVLLDDRDERAGVKFADADLIGIPMRVVVSARSLNQGGIELKMRQSGTTAMLPLEGLAEALTRRRAALLDEIERSVVVPSFR